MGGAETWLVEMVKYARDHETGMPGFDFLAAGGEKAIFDQVVKDAGCTIHYLALRKGNIFTFIRGLRIILKENDYIAIHDHQGYLSGWHFLFGIRYLPSVRIVHFHNPIHHLHYYGVTTERRLKLKVGRSLLKLFATNIFGTSDKILGEYSITPALFPDLNIRSLYCAFQIDRFSGQHTLHKEQLLNFLGWPSETKIVLFAGRLDQSTEIGDPNNSKNSAFALEVVGACKESNIKMIMVGANDFIIEKFNKLIESKDLQDRVRMLGIRNDMPHIMLASDVLLFPSRAEGMGMVAVEAQAAGLPVLSSDMVPEEVTVLKELIKFQSLNDSFDSWAGNLQEMMNRRLPGDTVMDNRWQSSGFNMEVCCRQLASIYLNQHQPDQVLHS